MQLLPSPSGKRQSTALTAAADPALPIILEFQSPSTAIINIATPRGARNVSWSILLMVTLMLVVAFVVKVDRVVSTPGRVVSQAATLVVQPLETSIIRSIEVHEGETVHAGQLLARLDPTFAAADLGSLAAQVSMYQAQVSRMQAELDNRPFSYTGMDPNLLLQAAIFSNRRSEYDHKMSNYREKIDGLEASLRKAKSDVVFYRDRLNYARTVEQMRKDLEHLNVGSKITTLQAMDSRAEIQRTVDGAAEAAVSAERDLAALKAERDGYDQSWRADIAEKLSEAVGKLSDARENLNKAQLRRQLVEMRADRDATVLSVGKMSIGSVVTAGQQMFTLVPADAPLEIEINIPGTENGYVHLNDPVAIKFDTFPYSQYGMAYGVVRVVSADSFTHEDDQRNPTGAMPVPASGPGSASLWYRARVSLDRVELHDVPKGFRLIPGMSVTSDILVGKRSIMTYLLGRYAPLAKEGMREP
jgi:hemolysin D